MAEGGDACTGSMLRNSKEWGRVSSDFDGFMELHGMMPNYPPASLAWERSQTPGLSDAEASGLTSITDCEPASENLHAPQAQPQDHAKQKNRQAQKKFRDRQKVKSILSRLELHSEHSDCNNDDVPAAEVTGTQHSVQRDLQTT